LLTDGILAGLSGVLVFIPQIAILFLLISLLEEVGYMSRAVYIFDKLMQKFGLNGRSMVSLIAGGACAIPAIMSTRTISNWKERMITIMVTPLISCSARIPVYILLISFAIPPTLLWGIINQQTFVFFGLYLFSTLIALFIAFLFSKILKTKDHSYLALELPDYRLPHWRNVALTVLSKVGSFVTEAGKIILMVSVVLWAITRFGPGDAITQSTGQAKTEAATAGMDSLQTDAHIAARNLQASYAGKFGKWIEPAIAPLGFDWKIGIALLTSFAAREVFVGTMATIYSLNDNEDTKTIKQKMKGDINPDTGKPVFTLATSLSLLMFYVFAMQCMSTIAVVKRETKSWKWPMLQLAYMSVLAYLASFIVYQIFK
jgi:ferrous iron transport protein B